MKKESLRVVHCGVILSLKDGKARCPVCHTIIKGNFRTEHEPRDHRKHEAKRYYTFGDSVYLLGWYMLIGTGFAALLGLYGLSQNGLRSFSIEGFTVMVIVALIGFAIVRLMSEKKARQ